MRLRPRHENAGVVLQLIVYPCRRRFGSADHDKVREGGTGHWLLLHRAAAVSTDRATRSEEHTSELQSLMRSSYAVFCLKKKNKIQTQVQASEGGRIRRPRTNKIPAG